MTYDRRATVFVNWLGGRKGICCWSAGSAAHGLVVLFSRAAVHQSKRSCPSGSVPRSGCAGWPAASHPNDPREKILHPASNRVEISHCQKKYPSLTGSSLPSPWPAPLATGSPPPLAAVPIFHEPLRRVIQRPRLLRVEVGDNHDPIPPSMPAWLRVERLPSRPPCWSNPYALSPAPVPPRLLLVPQVPSARSRRTRTKPTTAWFAY